MELKYLWDTNTAIYYLQKLYPVSVELFFDDITNYQPAISVISEIELLCWPDATNHDIGVLNTFISRSFVFELNNEIKKETIKVRKHFRLKVPDAIIAATALVESLTLISRNLSDFKRVVSLKVTDPFNLN